MYIYNVLWYTLWYRRVKSLLSNKKYSDDYIYTYMSKMATIYKSNGGVLTAINWI